MQLKRHWLWVGVVYEFKALATLPVWQPAVIQAISPINRKRPLDLTFSGRH
jgi:hypothetical protein